MLEVKFCGSVEQRNITRQATIRQPKFVGTRILVDPKVTDSADWSQWIRYALDGTASIPQPFDQCAVAFQQFRPEATRRLAGRGCVRRRTDGRGMEIVAIFRSEIIADEPSLLEDVDFL